jgi:hypothetical protein
MAERHSRSARSLQFAGTLWSLLGLNDLMLRRSRGRGRHLKVSRIGGPQKTTLWPEIHVDPYPRVLSGMDRYRASGLCPASTAERGSN